MPINSSLTRSLTFKALKFHISDQTRSIIKHFSFQSINQSMASGSNSPTSDTFCKISDKDSENYEITDHDDEFNDWELVIGLSGLSTNGDNCSDDDDDENKRKCVGKKNDELSWGVYMDRNVRRHMEDRIVTFPGFMSMKCDVFGGCIAPKCEFALEESPIHYFAVFDGHGGSQVSDYCADSLHEEVREAWQSESSTNEWSERWHSALSKAYDNIDKACVQGHTGSTAVVVLISSCQIIAANCGDSRAILCRGFHTIPLTEDHKPDRPDEEDRIFKSGGHVRYASGTMRVEGVLAMSRAIGDKSLKPYVSAVPELTFTTRTDEDECLIIASDGLWDVMSTETVGTKACQMLEYERQVARFDERPAQCVARHLFDEACTRSSTDNFSVIVIDLKPQNM